MRGTRPARRLRPHVQRRARVVLAVRAQAPCTPDVVLQTGAADGGELRVAVAVHLHLALAVPHALVEHAHADVAADESSGTLEPVGDDEVATAARSGSRDGMPTWRKPSASLERGLERVVDLVVEEHRCRRRVRDLDAHVLRERHREIRVEAATFLRRRQRRRVLHRTAVRHAEEVEARHRHARLARRRRRRPPSTARASSRAARAGTSSRHGARFPGPSTSASTTVSPGEIVELGRPLRPL